MEWYGTSIPAFHVCIPIVKRNRYSGIFLQHIFHDQDHEMRNKKINDKEKSIDWNDSHIEGLDNPKGRRRPKRNTRQCYTDLMPNRERGLENSKKCVGSEIVIDRYLFATHLRKYFYYAIRRYGIHRVHSCLMEGIPICDVQLVLIREKVQ